MSESKAAQLKKKKGERKRLLEEERAIQAELDAGVEERKEARKEVTACRLVVEGHILSLRIAGSDMSGIISKQQTFTKFDRYKEFQEELLNRTDELLTAATEHNQAIQKVKDLGG
ncbi:MAG: hypothetical protein COB09_18435 [Thalassobium sp.]|nr:MAG: hypothetical protein COB09_18435 [Thalassobium sp.]